MTAFYALHALMLAQLALLSRLPWQAALGLLPLCLVAAYLFRKQWNRALQVNLILVALLPALVFLRQRPQPFPVLPADAARHLQESLDLEHVLQSGQREAILQLLRRPDQGLANPDNHKLQAALLPEPYQAVTLLNLDGEPLLWAGNTYAEIDPVCESATPRLEVVDGRLFYRVCRPFPEAEQIEGYLLLESLILSSHQSETRDTWLVRQIPQFASYQAVVADARGESFVAELADQLGVARLPFEFRFMELERISMLDEVLVGLWLALLFRLMLGARRLAKTRHDAWLPAIGLAILVFANGVHLPNVTIFGSYIFASTQFYGLLISPGHFLVSGYLVFLLLHHVQALFPTRAMLFNLFFLCLLAWFTWLGAAWLQTLNSFSLVHPLEALNAPGSLTVYLAFLAVPVYLVYLLRQSKFDGPRVKIAVSALIATLTAILAPEAWVASGSLIILWWFVHRAVSQVLLAALLVLLFYPAMVRHEHRAEVDFVRHQMLDEITLLVERNHFRMGRLIRKLPTLEKQIADGVHPLLMEMFAKRNGLLEEHIDFALQLRDDSGTVVSVIDQHISLDRIREFEVPLEQIGTMAAAENPDGAAPEWLVFRTMVSAAGRDYEFLAVLGNNFHNLSLIRELGRLPNQRYPVRAGDTFPYFAYILDVYDQKGQSLYDQGNPAALTVAERERLEKDFIFWKADVKSPRNTLFFFSGPPYIYRITHKATPLRMISVRYLALMLACWVMLRGHQLMLKPTRTPLNAWQRSFSLKMAAFMFLTSLLPTATLGYLLIKSIRKNQVREVESMARSNIRMAKRLFQQHLHPNDTDDADIDWNATEPRTRRYEQASRRYLPVARFSRILNEDLSIYLDGRLYKTQQPEIYRMGLLSRRLPYQLARDLIVEGKPYSFKRRNLPDGSSILVTYSALRLADGRNAVISMTMIPFNRRQSLRWLEQLEFSGTVLIGLFFAMAGFTRLVARNFLRPVSAITRGAMRMAKGLQNRPIVVHRHDELQRMVSAFNTMQEQIRMSEHLLLEQLKVQKETLVAMSGGLLGFDRRGKVLLQNAKARELLELAEEAVSLDHLIGQQAALKPLQAMLEQGKSGECSMQLHQEEGEQELLIKGRVVNTPTEDGLYFIVAVEDVTDALAAGRFKAWSEMARRVAHEIKNPLTPIQLEIDYLVKLYQDQHPEFEQALSETRVEISRQVEILRQTATEFGDYARPIEPDLEMTDLAVLLDELVQPYQRSADGLTLDLAWPETMVILADVRLLRRALQNLVVNAVQAMGGEGRLGIVVEAVGESWLCHVEDTGPGIPREDHHRVFEAYFSTKDQGTGLGLIIAKRTIQIHGGTIHIDPDYEVGTRFVIRLPKWKVAP
ncbi:sensor histidine kinase [Acanthopleuribacter pedis]|uniref:histidine kinase n=1 Tax=Acanthopleuribacter pedis TaxID=442870 RepID=A0A8J7Q9X3_9BACT|nr:ATP-binding protein [Acanthopleuribacter pedis]MBO1322732.1 HAMP domain-containing protein [Acanthopleuribacter pedis]